MKIKPIDRSRYLTGEQLTRLYLTLWDLSMRPTGPMTHQKIFFVRFALGTGLRSAEIADLKLEDCHPDGVVQVNNGKGGKSRQVAVTPECLPYYQERLKLQKKNLLTWYETWPDQDSHTWTWLFERWKSRYGWGKYNTRTFRKWWSWLCAEAQVPDLGGPHGLRHTYATWEIACRRLRPHELQSSLGHKSFETTSNVYNGGIAEHAYNHGTPDWYQAALTGRVPGKDEKVAILPGDPIARLQRWIEAGRPTRREGHLKCIK